MEDTPTYNVDSLARGKTYYPGGTSWPMPGNSLLDDAYQVDNILTPTVPSVVPIQGGVKFSQNKIQYSLIPPYALQEVARNLTTGLKKYIERDNWKKVPNAKQEYLDALMRHLESYRRGNMYDTDSSASNMHEMSAICANAMFIMEFDLDPNLTEVKETK
jgi:hypothetical protein